MLPLAWDKTPSHLDSQHQGHHLPHLRLLRAILHPISPILHPQSQCVARLFLVFVGSKIVSFSSKAHHTEAFGMPSIHRTYLIPGLHPSRRPHIYPLASPRLGFPTLYLAAPMAEYTYGRSYTTSSPGCPYTPPHTRCLDVLERRRDVVRQHLWPYQSRLWS